MADINKIKRIQGGTLKTARAQDATIDMNVRPYTGEYVFTPTQEAQTVPVAWKVPSQNITINPIPSNYGLITWDGSSLMVS